ncbi:MAG TPA: prepilin-type N-terminal cleavage/methylation domain-containing protein [Vicinamibacterales bacterium]
MNDRRNHQVPRSREAGFNLVEVLVAMALLGTVLIAVMSLFFLGRRNVYSGRQMTKAIAIGNRVLEDLQPLIKKDIYNGAFAINDTDKGSSVTILGTTYLNCKIRSTKATLIPSPPSDIQTEQAGGPGFLAKWNSQLGTDLGQNGAVTLIMQPTDDPSNASPNEQFGTSQILRLHVLVQWTEPSDPSRPARSIVLDSDKVY